jgi:transcription elongation factor Elf1
MNREVSVATSKAYNWVCPRCKKINIQYGELNKAVSRLKCTICGMKMEHVISIWDDREIYKEVQ